jgi:hypothetical protein
MGFLGSAYLTSPLVFAFICCALRRWLAGDAAIRTAWLFVDAGFGALWGSLCLVIVVCSAMDSPAGVVVAFLGIPLVFVLLSLKICDAIGAQRSSAYRLAIQTYLLMLVVSGFLFASPFKFLGPLGWAIYIGPLNLRWIDRFRSVTRESRMLAIRWLVLVAGIIGLAAVLARQDWPWTGEFGGIFIGIPASAALFWPVFRYLGPAAFVAAEERTRTPATALARSLFLQILDHPWWAAPAIALVVSLGVENDGNIITGWSHDFAILAVPIAVWFGARHGPKSTVPVLAGSLPLLVAFASMPPLAPSSFAVTLTSNLAGVAGGAWSFLTIQLWRRFAADPRWRARMLQRENIPWLEPIATTLVLLPVLVYGAGAQVIVLFLQPQWMLVSFALLVGMSRIARWRFAIVLAALFALFLALPFEPGLRLPPTSAFLNFGSVPQFLVDALFALYLPCLWQVPDLSAGGRSLHRFVLPWLFAILNFVVINRLGYSGSFAIALHAFGGAAVHLDFDSTMLFVVAFGDGVAMTRLMGDFIRHRSAAVVFAIALPQMIVAAASTILFKGGTVSFDLGEVLLTLGAVVFGMALAWRPYFASQRSSVQPTAPSGAIHA